MDIHGRSHHPHRPPGDGVALDDAAPADGPSPVARARTDPEPAGEGPGAPGEMFPQLSRHAVEIVRVDERLHRLGSAVETLVAIAEGRDVAPLDPDKAGAQVPIPGPSGQPPATGVNPNPVCRALSPFI